MRKIIFTDPPRAARDGVEALTRFGVATVHEALGRTGLVGPAIRPVQAGARIAGTAVTVLSWPGDNLMIHAAVEQCREGDVLVVATTSESSDGMFGELFATALQHRGVRGLVISAGVRDVAELRAMNFPVWSRAINAQGTVKATGGSVNIPVHMGNALVSPGDVVIADDDGVMIVPRADVATAVTASEAREAKEQRNREAFRRGELGMDIYGLRGVLAELGVTYETAPPE
ncbi:4-carboxy-4-hydroxy-2-oxoadipate aldolase/oxaloacetate decarboxylase [Lentzea sp. NPDC059081]|uniref:4-carboxy-4-hydroxy-2-oxoadipate aldolase/oxaloacetate decarboxylase n=1 Tax=Lentzea sp. NPDC059081 TaxID=3346719 RepID=UPI0036AF2830